MDFLIFFPITLKNTPSDNQGKGIATSLMQILMKPAFSESLLTHFLRLTFVLPYDHNAFNICGSGIMAAIGRFQKGDDIFYAKVVDGELFKLKGDVFGSPSFQKRATNPKGIKTLTPVAPSKVIAVGLNYADHARESGKPLPKTPLFWLKAPTSLIPDGGKIEIPFQDHRVDYEAELAIVIGRRMRNVTANAAARYIFGYTSAQDISDRTIQKAESQWARAKSFDTFTPLGPYVETKIDPHKLTIQLFQNGQLRQNSLTGQLIFNCFELVSFISTNITLLPGDVILTGTPSGVGPIQSGDKLEVRIQGMSPLVNTVK